MNLSHLPLLHVPPLLSNTSLLIPPLDLLTDRFLYLFIATSIQNLHLQPQLFRSLETLNISTVWTWKNYPLMSHPKELQTNKLLCAIRYKRIMLNCFFLKLTLVGKSTFHAELGFSYHNFIEIALYS